MRQKIKTFMCYLSVIVLLPYVVTVFLNGPSLVSSSNIDARYVKVKSDSGTIQMPMEEYCIGILAKEIPADYEQEALKAQAILVRTDIYGKLAQNGNDMVLEDSFWSKQQMGDSWGTSKYSSNYSALEKAWEETEGQVLIYNGKTAKTPFFRLSNGSTRDGREALGSEEYPYLKIVDCPLDIEDVRQVQTITIDDMDAEITACDTAGYVLNVRVGNNTISGEEFRANYHLDSSCFSFQKYNGKLRITTRGIGHGLGMSQYTANEMAKEGKTVEEILDYFFEGTELKEVVEIVELKNETEESL